MSEFTGIYRAVVFDTNDPSPGRGRVRLLIPAVLGTSPSGWAEPLTGAPVAPSAGELAWVLFEGGDLNRPTYMLSSNVDTLNASVSSLNASVTTLGNTYPRRYTVTKNDAGADVAESGTTFVATPYMNITVPAQVGDVLDLEARLQLYHTVANGVSAHTFDVGGIYAGGAGSVLHLQEHSPTAYSLNLRRIGWTTPPLVASQIVGGQVTINALWRAWSGGAPYMRANATYPSQMTVTRHR